ncbi:unnamed protein product [Schistosoma mattheei]|uniref:Uncharacterized protein n=1 Tax=Schistosoma mattheei TaxID=31246 RepID=A0A3P8DTS1_9TREM|nr:unnamed protein product [Schistosoma mattheei]
MYSLQSIYGTLIRQWASPRKVLTARCNFDVSWFVTLFQFNSSRLPVISTLIIYVGDLQYDLFTPS